MLFVDAEGWDLAVLQGLEHTAKRPRVNVTEDFEPTNQSKYHLLESYGYHMAGFWGSDSFWVYRPHQQSLPAFSATAQRCAPGWALRGNNIHVGNAMLDEGSCFRNSLAGWVIQQGSGYFTEVCIGNTGLPAQRA